MENVNYLQSNDSDYIATQQNPWTPIVTGTDIIWNNKTPREQVCDEIMMKMVEAIESDDLKQAKKLAKLAKAIKEL